MFWLPGDKSISHRSLLLGMLGDGVSQIRGFLPSGDCLATLGCLRALGVRVETHGPTHLTVHGGDLKPPARPLDCVRSGTTMRLLAGILASQPFDSQLTGAPQLTRRPMRRIVDPLRRMGADIEDVDGHAPLTIRGRRLNGCEQTLAVASAQVKSAILLAGLRAQGETVIHQPGPARDHTERMLAAMGADIEVQGLTVRLAPSAQLAPLEFTVPGDISSAAFPLVAASLVPNSAVKAQEVGVNKTRTGLLDVLESMGADITVEEEAEQGGEPTASVSIRASSLSATAIGGDTVVRMIDEFPILAVAATQARGKTVVRDASELRVKETDRIATVVTQLRRLGAEIEATTDGFSVQGPTPLHGGRVDSQGDHRLAMAMVVAGLIASSPVEVLNADCISDSFPGFVDLMRGIGADLE